MVVIIGIGNSVMADDGFGIHVIEALRTMAPFADIPIIDAMTHTGMLLEALDGTDKAIIVDAMELEDDDNLVLTYRFNPHVDEFPAEVALSLHDIQFKDLIAMARTVYDLPAEIVIIGTRPHSIAFGTELTDACKSAIAPVIEAIQKELERA